MWLQTHPILMERSNEYAVVETTHSILSGVRHKSEPNLNRLSTFMAEDGYE